MVSMNGIWCLEYWFWNFFLTQSSFYIWSTTLRVCFGKDFSTWNSFYVWRVSFQVLLSKRKNLLFPMHYCVGIVEFFLDSGVPNLYKPPSTFFRCRVLGGCSGIMREALGGLLFIFPTGGARDTWCSLNVFCGERGCHHWWWPSWYVGCWLEFLCRSM